MPDQGKEVSIYRFEPADCSRIESLSDGQLFMADPAKFNDPLDLQPNLRCLARRTGFAADRLKAAVEALFHDIDLTHTHWLYSEEVLREIKRWISRGVTVNADDIATSVKQQISKFGVQCFSSRFDIPLSWSHYASGHKGFCIEYDLRKMTLAEKNPCLSMYNVTYSNQLPQVCVSEVLFTPHQVIPRLLATKTIDWAYEQEFRLVHFTEKGKKIDMPEGLRIASLIAGLNISEKNLDLLKRVGKELSVPVFKMSKDETPRSNQLWGTELA